MFERFTDKAVKVIQLAQAESWRLGQHEVGPEHVLLALISEGTGLASKALRSSGVPLNEARTELEKLTGRGPAGPRPEEFPFSEDAKSLLVRSWEQSTRLGNRHICTEHFLLALLEDSDGLPCRVLIALDKSPDRVRQELVAVMDDASG